MGFPEHTRKGIRTRLLSEVVADMREKRVLRIVVKTGKNEDHARRFCEKNGFRQVREESLQTPWEENWN
ncbi:MAG: GNAT family N-acetyltransferase [Thermoproteota archaeon]